MSSENPEPGTRRSFLAGALTAGAVAVAGCSASGSTGDTPTEQPEPDATVTFATMTDETHPDSDDPDTWESVYQVSASLDSVTGPLSSVEATVITGHGDQTATWLVPDHIGESRVLGSRDVYDEDDIVNPEPGDFLIVTVNTEDGRSHLIERHELPGDSK